MTTYFVTFIEAHEMCFRVTADSPEEAKAKVDDGQGKLLDDSFSINDKDEWVVDIDE
jgi:hypothetical protein